MHTITDRHSGDRYIVLSLVFSGDFAIYRLLNLNRNEIEEIAYTARNAFKSLDADFAGVADLDFSSICQAA
jgi:hypothetical protein